MKGIAIFLGFLIVLTLATPGGCGFISTLLVDTSTAATNVQQKEIEKQQTEDNIFKDVNPDLAFALREMRLSNEHGNNTIARVAESGDRSQTAIAQSSTLTVWGFVIGLIIMAWIVNKFTSGNKQQGSVK
jgi:hypothetical protein